MEIIGKQIEVGLAVEADRGVAETVAEKWAKKITATIIERAEKKVDESTLNTIEDSQATRLVRKWIEGDLEGNVHADTLGYLLYNIYGSVASSEVATGVYSHIFNALKSITPPTLSIFSKDGANSQEVFNGGMINTLELSIVADDYAKFTASFMAKGNTANADTPSYNTEYDFVGKDVVVKVADTVSGLSGATAIKAKEVSLSFDKALVANQVVGSYNPDDIFAQQIAIEGSLNLNYTDDIFKDLFTADGYKAMSITITGSQTIGTASKPSITIILYRVGITEWSELSAQEISFKAFYSATDSKASQITVVNTTAEYDVPLS
jgi:hypothetical protein